MKALLAAFLLAFSALSWAGEAELELAHEYPVSGFSAGNLSGLTQCAGSFWAVSDRLDTQYYQLIPGPSQWQAKALPLTSPAPDNKALPWWISAENRLIGWLRGGQLDFESISCDAQGNRYLLSEAYVSVLKVSPQGREQWLSFPDNWLAQAQASNLLMRYNALLEGLAITPDGNQLWLAAERDQRGLIAFEQKDQTWQCAGDCIKLSEGGQKPSPFSASGVLKSLDFSDLVWHQGRLFSLERLEQKICRRAPHTAQVERCWSFASTALLPGKRYPVDYGMAEALWLDDQYAYIGLDNGELPRADGEQRPIIWQFNAPKGGWNAP